MEAVLSVIGTVVGIIVFLIVFKAGISSSKNSSGETDSLKVIGYFFLALLLGFAAFVLIQWAIIVAIIAIIALMIYLN